MHGALASGVSGEGGRHDELRGRRIDLGFLDAGRIILPRTIDRLADLTAWADDVDHAAFCGSATRDEVSRGAIAFPRARVRHCGAIVAGLDEGR
jgi:hypothetical protein